MHSKHFTHFADITEKTIPITFSVVLFGRFAFLFFRNFVRIVSQTVLKIKSEAGVGLRRIGALYAAYGQVKGDVGGGCSRTVTIKIGAIPSQKDRAQRAVFAISHVRFARMRELSHGVLKSEKKVCSAFRPAKNDANSAQRKEKGSARFGK